MDLESWNTIVMTFDEYVEWLWYKNIKELSLSYQLEISEEFFYMNRFLFTKSDNNAFLNNYLKHYN